MMPSATPDAQPSLPRVQSLPGRVVKASTFNIEDSFHKALTPQEYATAILAHSRQGTETSLYPGHNFTNLAAYLCGPYESQRNLRPSSTRRASSTNCPNIPKHPYSFVFLYTFYASGSKTIDQIKSPQRLEGFSPATSKEGEKAASQILFLRGQPSAEWLSTIGAKYRIDPEFFQRHLDFRSTTGRLNYFPLPSLPSSAKKIIRLRFITIGEWEGQSHGPDQMAIDELRGSSAKAMARYLHRLNLSMEADEGLGNSIVRSFSVHDEKHFAIEQEISICISWTASGWTALVWLDAGNNLSQGSEGPWLRTATRQNPNRTSLYPTIQIQPWGSLKSHRMSLGNNSIPAGRFTQSSLLLHLDYGKTLDQQLMACDPFYALHELFLFSAFSEIQMLNMLDSKLSAETSSTILSKPTWDQSNLLYSQEILEAHADRLRETMETIRSRGDHKWPQAPDPAMRQKALSASESLLKDYEHLLVRTEKLSSRCTARINIQMNRAMTEESRKAIIQAQEVTKLTRLAFVYIPLSFTASVFGMNLSPIVDNASNNIWLWFAVSVPILVVSLALMKWDLLKLYKKVIESREESL